MEKQQKIWAFLTQLGLNDKETSIYLALLTLGRSPVSDIAEEAKVTRTHVYTIAEDLRERGYLCAIEEQNTRMYEALNHPGLVALIARQRDQLNQLGKKVAESVSDFEALRRDRKPAANVRFFRGKEGVLQIHEEIKRDLKKLTAPFEIITIYSPEKLEATFPGWFENKKYIDIPPLMTKRDIVTESEIFRKNLEQRAKSKSKYLYRIWPKERGEFPIDTLCWQDNVAFIELSDYPTGTIIKNDAVAKTFKLWFNQMWDSLENNYREPFVREVILASNKKPTKKFKDRASFLDEIPA